MSIHLISTEIKYIKSSLHENLKQSKNQRVYGKPRKIAEKKVLNDIMELDKLYEKKVKRMIYLKTKHAKNLD